MDLGILNKANTGEIALSIFKTPFRATGLSALVQQVLIDLLSDPIPGKGRGAGLITLITSADVSEIEVIKRLCRSAISLTKSNIQSMQQLGTVNNKERLNDLVLDDVKITSDFQILVDIKVTNQANETISFSVPTTS